MKWESEAETCPASRKKIPKNSEGSTVLLGGIPNLRHTLSFFVRLDEAREVIQQTFWDYFGSWSHFWVQDYFWAHFLRF